MKDLSTDSLIVVILFIIPGFVALKAWASVAVAPASNDKSMLLSAIAASACLYAPVSPLLYWAYSTNRLDPAAHPIIASVLAFVSLCAWPAVAGLGIARIRRASWWQRASAWLGLRPPELRAWDTFFSTGERYYVRALLKDGRWVGGLYVPGSSASSYPASEDLYLSIQYVVDSSGTFGEPIPRTRGCWLDMTNVQCLEFLTVEERDEQQQGQPDAGGTVGRPPADAESGNNVGEPSVAA